jgi:hypothetical protein
MVGPFSLNCSQAFLLLMVLLGCGKEGVLFAGHFLCIGHNQTIGSHARHRTIL